MSRCSRIAVLLAGATLAGLVPAADAGAVTIGVVAGRGPSGEALIAGAERAAREWNASPVGARQPIRLRVSAPARPWDGGAAEMARLIFDGDVVAVIGDDDATTAHVAAQIATVKRIPFLSLTPEDGLTRVFDPWIFRGVPAERDQLAAVLRRVLGRIGGRRVVAVVPAGRDGRERARAIEAACAELGVGLAGIARVPTGGEPDLPPAFAAADTVLAWLDAADAVALLRHLARTNPGAIVLGSTRLDTTSVREAAAELGVALAVPAVGPEAVGYDMVRVVAEAAAETGADPAAVRRAIAAGATRRGRSGAFRFDDRGNRVGEVPMLVVGGELPPTRPSPPGGA